MKVPEDTVGVVIGTFGDYCWEQLAYDRALASVRMQRRPVDEVVTVHRDSLADARNTGLHRLKTDWVIFLDADDELDERYVLSMVAARLSDPDGDIYKPAVQDVADDGVGMDKPYLYARHDIHVANHIPIGAMCRRNDVEAVGGFEDQPILEDWVLWLKVVSHLKAAVIADVPRAVYRRWVTPDSRNNQPALANRTAEQIRRRFA